MCFLHPSNTFKYTLFFFLSFGWSTLFAQADSTLTPIENPTNLAYNITNRPWAVLIDLTRLTYQTPSIQLSVSYRPFFRFGFESELNYYLNKSLDPLVESIDFIHVRLAPNKANFFISGIGKVYFGRNRIYYLGARVAAGSSPLRLSRNVCVEAEPTTSNELCRCLQTENRSLDVTRTQMIYGLRYGINLPVTERLRLDLFVAYDEFKYSHPDYQYLHHVCENSWPRYKKIPKTDGIFDEFQEHKQEAYFSLGLKIGYAF